MKSVARRLVAIAVAFPLVWLATQYQRTGTLWVLSAQGTCANPANAIVAENCLAGSSPSEWDLTGQTTPAGDPTIQGFASDISVNTGQTVNFKIQTSSSNYKIDVYRLGYYGGAGARQITTLGPFVQPQNQAVTCATDKTTGLVDCGNWSVSASWASTGAVSGIYVAKLTRIDTGGSSHIVFIVRDDARQADLVVQTSDTTWVAYNQYGGGSLYCGGPISNAGSVYGTSCANRSAKVSYNRPFDTRAHDARSFVFAAEYPMVRWLEANGYDIKYWAGVDTDRRGADLTGVHKPKAFVSVGHDEYWSGDQRTAVENARNAGVNLAFFSGNEMYWKTRYEPSIDGSNTANRTLVTYKETLASAKIDPAVDATGHPVWTGSWRDPRFSPPADGGRPENAVTGTIWTVNSGTTAITVPAAMARLRFWQNTRVATLTSGVATLSAESLGYEWDEDLDNGARPDGLIHLSSTTVDGVEKIIDNGSKTGLGTATHSLTLYRHASGALVFGVGTVQWTWGLDAVHDGGAPAAHLPDQAIQQSTVNLFTDMGAHASTLQVGLIEPNPSTDMFPPTTVITSPAAGGQVQSGNRVTISGTATDNGGGVVAGVEVSVDGGATWRPAQGTATWRLDWSPGAVGAATILSRATDDSGNLEAAGAGVTVSIAAGNCPCNNLWRPSAVPTVLSVADPSAVELGVKFTSDADGFIIGVRFYKGPDNSGTHQGNLWTIDGALLATAVFTSETASGWQQVNFETPLKITANTTYVASYHTNVGGYSANAGYFTDAGVDSLPLHALPSNSSGGNGVFRYGTTAFPTNTFNNANYWVDVMFGEVIADSTPLAISDIGVTVVDGSTADIAWRTSAEATSQIDYSSVDPALVAPSFTQTDGTFVTRHSLRLTGLTFNATYNFTITAVDRSGGIALAKGPGFTLPGPRLHDTASADFLAGTVTDIVVAQMADGELILEPAFGSEFSGHEVPAGWVYMPWRRRSYAVLHNGLLQVDGARVAMCATDTNGACLPGEAQSATASAIFTGPHSLEFSSAFSGDPFQHAGFAQTLAAASEPWAIFSTFGGGRLFARTSTGSASIDTELSNGSELLGSFHRFRIDWKAASVDYYVDGTLLVSHALAVGGPMRPVAASDFDVLGGVMSVDWIRMTPYAAAGSFVSRVFDARAPVDWHSIQWAARAPLGTSVAISIRTGSTPTPPTDGTASGGWTAFVPIAAPGPLAETSQFIQYRADMTTSDPNQTPELDDIVISTDDPPVAGRPTPALLSIKSPSSPR